MEIKELQERLNNLPNSIEKECFTALYSILGMEELHDGIVSAMQDQGFDEWIEDLLYSEED